MTNVCCVKCRTEMEITPVHGTFKYGVPATGGTCPKCGAELFTFDNRKKDKTLTSCCG
jgi:hypothetical protein